MLRRLPMKTQMLGCQNCVCSDFIFKIFGSVAGLAFGNLFGRALSNDFAAAVTAFGADVDNIVCGFDNVEVMFDNNHGVSLFDQGMENFEQFVDVFKMQSGRGFVQNVQRFAGGSFGQFFRQFDTLGFAAGKRGGGLTEVNVSEAYLAQKFQPVFEGRNGVEEDISLVYGHIQHVGYVLSLKI